MPMTNKIKIMLDGAFMPDYYSSLATYYLNVWVEFETAEEYNTSKQLILKSENLCHTVCFNIILISNNLINLYY